jgi:hypothetical protein
LQGTLFFHPPSQPFHYYNLSQNNIFVLSCGLLKL